MHAVVNGDAAESGEVPQHEVATVQIALRWRRPRDERVHLYRWRHPAPRAHVVIAHGAGDHGMRYSGLARRLVSAGCSVVAFDNLGHGRTGHDGAGLGVLGPGQNRAAIACLGEVVQREREVNPGVPLVLFGHSWGALLAQRLFAVRSDHVQGLMLSGTSLAVPGLLNPGDLDKPWRTDDLEGTQWLSRDPESRAAFTADPFTFDIRMQPVWSPLGALQLMTLPPVALVGRVDDVPVLILAGELDTVGYGTRGPSALARSYRRRSALSDVTLRVYEGARHEVMHETNRDVVMADVAAWIRLRFAAPPQPTRAEAH
ncbi:lysophospholipase [Pseudoclavibacter endophyticus]|uniref:Alpha/beta hydrolase n=1 Tax=Pseudoclavibacter endophyticus TaxID=1778590 RepID=A0A6H9WRJ7_9MICO|nr:alpha/beta hydrolase [Pseudoclavibacter endophyticus]KAB1648960.1 alpha/beta hydrolase [Pseudoclavibacter endophyticus]GGA66740.1 lysophospholipase [Pseudoclavibacter endophyticus]